MPLDEIHDGRHVGRQHHGREPDRRASPVRVHSRVAGVLEAAVIAPSLQNEKEPVLEQSEGGRGRCADKEESFGAASPTGRCC
jgi:hypothetical protein